MGAEFNSVMFADHLGHQTILQMWDDLCEQSRYDRGHSYSGAIGMLRGTPCMNDTLFATRSEAEDYVAARHDKWEPPVAASFTDGGAKFWIIGGWCSS